MTLKLENVVVYKLIKGNNVSGCTHFFATGADCELVVSPAGPSNVNSLAGRNVTLAVSFSGASDPVVTWFIRDLPVVTWTIASSEPPDIAEERQTVLQIESNGSLTFLNVPVSYTDSYTVEMTKSGLGKSRTTFSLKVYGGFDYLMPWLDAQIYLTPPSVTHFFPTLVTLIILASSVK